LSFPVSKCDFFFTRTAWLLSARVPVICAVFCAESLQLCPAVYFLLECNCFTMSCPFLLCRVNQLHGYIYALPPAFPSHLTTPIPPTEVITEQLAELPVLYSGSPPAFDFTHCCCCCSVTYVVSEPLRPYGLQHARPPCLSLSPGVFSNACPLSW